MSIYIIYNDVLHAVYIGIRYTIHSTLTSVYNNNKENQHRKRGEKMDRAKVLKPTRFCSFGEERQAPTHTYTHMHKNSYTHAQNTPTHHILMYI